MSVTLETLWKDVGFAPNDEQRRAILHADGPLYLPAGPGSGKTRVLLWRTLNLIVFHEVPPQEIFLGTFTEKGAHQLREGLRGLLSIATERLNRPFDISRMAIGTIHSICRFLLLDRRLSEPGVRPEVLALLDEFDQYRFVYRARRWERITAASELEGDVNEQLVAYFENRKSSSRHRAVTVLLSCFNRLSEESLDLASTRPRDPMVRGLIRMYGEYRTLLQEEGKMDLSLLQWHAHQRLLGSPKSTGLFQHVIIDEYQDTNAIQEKIYFRLASKARNLCVVGDDDQSMYRFRGATVDNFLQFPKRCKEQLGVKPAQITLDTNYRSRKRIVSFYNAFITEHEWTVRGQTYRVAKRIKASSKEDGPAVMASEPATPADSAEEVAEVVARLLREKRVTAPNQIAFLYPSLDSAAVVKMRDALETRGLKVYAPRAGSFMEQEESLLVFGLYLLIFGRPDEVRLPAYATWIDRAVDAAERAARADRPLAAFIKSRQEEIAGVLHDEQVLLKACGTAKIDPDSEYLDKHETPLAAATGLSDDARKFLRSGRLKAYLRHQRARRTDRVITVGYVINRASSLDWGVLDLFYHLTTFDTLKQAFDLAQAGTDEGPICNLSQISDYLSRFQSDGSPVLSANFLRDDKFVHVLFSSYLYSVFRRDDGEYEDKNEPFPKGRIPFLTVHQAKGLEFPVVVLGNLRKDAKSRKIDELVTGLGAFRYEPENEAPAFDVARMFYVALSRAQQLVILCPFKGQGQRFNKEFIDPMAKLARPLAELDVSKIDPKALEHDSTPKPYSFTGDYIKYGICARRYMLERRYAFVPSRGQTTIFGNLVHRTIEDLHQYLIGLRADGVDLKAGQP